MQKSRPGSTKTNLPPIVPQIPEQAAICVAELARRIPEFLYECQYRGHSPRTIEEEKSVLQKFLRFLQENEIPFCTSHNIRGYLTCVAEGGMQRGGRWGQKPATPVRPRTVRNHWGYLRTFLNLNLPRFSYHSESGQLSCLMR